MGFVFIRRVMKLGYMLALLMAAAPVMAGNAVLIWPVDPVITGAQKGAELWVENRGASTTLMQVRVFGWQQAGGGDRYQNQQQVLASPPMIRLEPGQKQLIRLIKQQEPGAQQERAYRILLDEIPTPQSQPANKAHSLNLQMRYSLPLFVYGDQTAPDRGEPQLSWRRVSDGSGNWLEISNRGPVHARLSQAKLGNAPVSNGLLGYVLAGSSNRWPLRAGANASGQLEARVDNRKRTWRSPASSQ